METIKLFILRLLGRLHVDSVLASFEKTLQRLEASVQHHYQQELTHARAEIAAAEKKAEALANAVRANEVVQRIRGLIGK